MIAINKDGHTLIDVSNWEELEEIVGFKESIDTNDQSLKEIIGQYQFKILQPCSLSSCHQPHGKGFIFTTNEGLVGRMGTLCGLTHFGLRFTESKNSYRKAFNTQNWTENIEKFQNEMDTLLTKLNRLLTGNDSAIAQFSKIHNKVNFILDERTSSKLQDRAKKNMPDVKSQKQLEGRDREIYIEQNNLKGISDHDPIYIEKDTVFRINGLSGVKNYSKAKSLLTNTLYKNALAFKEINCQETKYSDLQYWDKWIKSIPENLKFIEEVSDECVRFCLLSNFSQIQQYKHLV